MSPLPLTALLVLTAGCSTGANPGMSLPMEGAEPSSLGGGLDRPAVADGGPSFGPQGSGGGTLAAGGAGGVGGGMAMATGGAPPAEMMRADSGAADRTSSPKPDAAAVPVDPPHMRAAGGRSAGCGSMVKPADGKQTIDVGGTTRRYIIRVPKTYDPQKPYAVVFGFHGYGNTAGIFDSTGGLFAFTGVFASQAFLLLPEGIPDSTGKQDWMRDQKIDLAFFDALIAKMKTDLCIDPSRIFATGHSAGGKMTNGLGCLRGDVFRGIAPVEGLLYGSNCTAVSPSAFIIHGEKDMIAPFTLGIKTRDFWLMKNGCMTTGPIDGATKTCVRYQGCRPGQAVEFCQHQGTDYNGTGHGWPSFATKAIWAFFSTL